MIPVDTLWHFTTWLDLFDHWQTIAGVLAFVAGFGTVVVTMVIARRQIDASRKEADMMIAGAARRPRPPSSKPKRPFVWNRSAVQAKPAHFTLCSKRR